MKLLILNCGSSSIKFTLFGVAERSDEPGVLLDGQFRGIGTSAATLTVGERAKPEQRLAEGADSPAAAIATILQLLQNAELGAIDAVGYRVVHPGPTISEHVRLTEAVLQQLESAESFAPLHDPAALTMIRETMRRLPSLPHFACFDTVFHQTMPEEASTYAIPVQYRNKGVKRYGFHGLSCESVVRQLRQVGTMPARMVIAHLGSGCSVTALVDGTSVDTTMGLTPTGGVVMGTRPGDLDPGLMLYLLRQQQGSDATGQVEKMLNHNGGMVALTELPNDMQAVRKAASDGNDKAALALKVFTRSVRKAMGGYAWLLGGLDALVFTGGIGEHDAETRAEVLSGTEAVVDTSRNALKGDAVRQISVPGSRTPVFVVPAQEDLVIALHVTRMVQAYTEATNRR